MEETIEKLKDFLTLLIKTSGFSLKTVEVRKDDAKTIKIEISIEGAGLVIGENGENIFAWEEVLNQWLRKNWNLTDHSADQRLVRQPADYGAAKTSGATQSGGYFRAVLDINNYRWQIEQRLRELAKKSAREAVLSKKPVKLPKMSSYERRIIHTELALHPNVATESEGQSPNRQVVVRPL